MAFFHPSAESPRFKIRRPFRKSTDSAAILLGWRRPEGLVLRGDQRSVILLGPHRWVEADEVESVHSMDEFDPIASSEVHSFTWNTPAIPAMVMLSRIASWGMSR